MKKQYLVNHVLTLVLVGGAMIYVATYHAETVRDVLRFVGIYSG